MEKVREFNLTTLILSVALIASTGYIIYLSDNFDEAVSAYGDCVDDKDSLAINLKGFEQVFLEHVSILDSLKTLNAEKDETIKKLLVGDKTQKAKIKRLESQKEKVVVIYLKPRESVILPDINRKKGW